MNNDFRVIVTLPTHPKTKKLMRQLGDRAFYNLIRLWAWVAQNKPEGLLANMDKDDIEIAADWDGDEGLFVDTLIALRFIDCEDGVCKIHDWEENNGYASAANKRSEKARLAAKARWDKRLSKDAKTCSEQCSGMLEHEPSNAPSPNPTPSPSPKDNTLTGIVGKTLPTPPNCPVEKIISVYNSTLPELPQCKTLSEQFRKMLRTRWREDLERQSVEWWREFFANRIRGSDYLMGKIKPWSADLTWIVRPMNFTKIMNGNYENRSITGTVNGLPPEEQAKRQALMEKYRQENDRECQQVRGSTADQ